MAYIFFGTIIYCEWFSLPIPHDKEALEVTFNFYGVFLPSSLVNEVNIICPVSLLTLITFWTVSFAEIKLFCSPRYCQKRLLVNGRDFKHIPLKRNRLWPECIGQRRQHGKELRHKTYEKFQLMFMSFQGSKVKLTAR